MEACTLSYACYGTFYEEMDGKGYSKQITACFEMLRKLNGIFDRKGINTLPYQLCAYETFACKAD